MESAAASTRFHQPHMERKMSAMTCEIFNELRLEGKLCDVVIKVNGFEFNAHKNILCSCSSYFRYNRVAELSQRGNWAHSETFWFISCFPSHNLTFRDPIKALSSCRLAPLFSEEAQSGSEPLWFSTEFQPAVGGSGAFFLSFAPTPTFGTVGHLYWISYLNLGCVPLQLPLQPLSETVSGRMIN